MPKVSKMEFSTGKGSRKEARASVWLYDKGKSPVAGILVNGKESGVYFSDFKESADKALRPFQVTNLTGKYHASVKVFGGGRHSQLEAVSQAIAKALVKKDESLKSILRKEGLLTRDDRMVESKRWGRHKSRRKQQFSKR